MSSLIRLQSKTLEGEDIDFNSNFKQAIKVNKNTKVGLKHLSFSFSDLVDIGGSADDRTIKVFVSGSDNVNPDETMTTFFEVVVPEITDKGVQEFLVELANAFNDQIPYAKTDADGNDILQLPNNDEYIGFQYYTHIENNRLVLGRNYNAKKNANFELFTEDGSGNHRVEMITSGHTEGHTYKASSVGGGGSFDAIATSVEYFTQGGGELQFDWINIGGNAYAINGIIGLIRPMKQSLTELEVSDVVYGMTATEDAPNTRYEVKYIENGTEFSFTPPVYKTTQASFLIRKEGDKIEFWDNASTPSLLKSVDYVRRVSKLSATRKDSVAYHHDLYNVCVAFSTIHSGVSQARFNRDERLLATADEYEITRDDAEYYRYADNRDNENNNTNSQDNFPVAFPEALEFSAYLQQRLGFKYRDIVLEQMAYNIESLKTIVEISLPDFIVIELENMGEFENYADSKIDGARRNILNIVNKNDLTDYNFKFNVDSPLMMSLSNRDDFLLSNLRIRVFDGETNKVMKVDGKVSVGLYLTHQ